MPQQIIDRPWTGEACAYAVVLAPRAKDGAS